MSASAELSPESFRQRLGLLQANFQYALATGKRSSLLQRMQRSRDVFELMMDFSVAAQRDALRGMVPSFDLASLLYMACLEAVDSHFQKVAKAKSSISDFVRQPANCLALFEEVQRVVAESNTFVQFGDLHQVDAKPKDPRVDVQQIASKQLQIVFPKFGSSVLEAMHESVKKHRQTNDDIHLSHARTCMALYLLCEHPNAKETAYASVEQKHLQNLAADLSSTKIKNLKVYLEQVSDRIEQESRRSEQIFGRASTVQKTRRAVQDALVAGRSSDIVDDPTYGVASTLRYPELRVTEFRQLFNILEYDPASRKKILTELSASVVRALRKHLPSPTLEALLEIRRAFSKLIQFGVPREQQLDFYGGLQEGLSTLVAVDGSFELAVSKKIDGLIREHQTAHQRGEVRRGSDSKALSSPQPPSQPPGAPHSHNSSRHVKAEIADALDLANLATLPHLLLDHLKQGLSDRLLLSRHPRLSLEQYTLSELARRRGEGFAHHLSVMLSEATCNQSLLNAAVWPGGRQPRCTGPPPPPVADAVEKLLQSERKRADSSQAIDVWCDPSLTIVEAELRFSSSPHPCRVQGNDYQIRLLLALNQAARKAQLLESELQLLTGFPPAMLAATLLSLKASGLVVQDAGTRRYSINHSFMDAEAGPKKISLSKVR